MTGPSREPGTAANDRSWPLVVLVVLAVVALGAAALLATVFAPDGDTPPTDAPPSDAPTATAEPATTTQPWVPLDSSKPGCRHRQGEDGTGRYSLPDGTRCDPSEAVDNSTISPEELMPA